MVSPVLQWRKFEFFNVEEGADVGALQAILSDGASVQCGGSGRGFVYVGDSNGCVHCLGRTLVTAAPSFPAHDAAVVGVWPAEAAPVLVTLAHPPDGCSEVKVWAVDRLHGDHPALLRLFRPDPRPLPPKGSNKAGLPPQVTALALHPSLNMLAMGFSSGAIMLYRGDLGKDREKHSTSRVLVTLNSSITNLHFRVTSHTYTAPPAKGRKGAAVNVQTSTLIVTTEDNVYNIACTHRDKETTSEVDSVGCRRGCSAVVEDGRSDHNLVLARDDALYCYNSEGRAGCYAFPGRKRLLHCHRGHATVLSDDANRSSTKCSVTLYDLNNKVIALSVTPSRPLVAMVGEWGALYGVTANTLTHFRERDLHNKMEILFKKNQYDIAVSLAKGQSVSGEGVAEILKQYGDWLYCKGDLLMAVHQYIKTIPHLEPSYVIKKFLSSEHMPLLAQYLEALHAANLHNADHSSLLLNCYTRHHHDDRIEAFIQKHSEQVAEVRGAKKGLNGLELSNTSHLSDGDVEALVAVCREGGFHQGALQLTALHGLHSLHLDVLCNDTMDHHKAIQYIRSLSFPLACEQMVSHGIALSRGCPDETIELLIELATDYTPDNTPLVGEAPLDSYLSGREAECAPPEMFEGVVCGDSLLAIRYIEGVTKRLVQLARPPPPPRMYEMLLAEYLHQLAAVKEGVVRETWEQKVRGLISEGRHPIDPSLACLLCDRHGYTQGKLAVWHQHSMWSEILQYHVSSGSEADLLEVCRQQESRDPGLWLTALRLLTAHAADAADSEVQNNASPAVLETLLDKVDEYSLLPPLEVIELVSTCGAVTLGQVRGYLLKLADREEQAMAGHDEVIATCVANTEAVRDQIQAIQTSGLVFTESSCDACHTELAFPTVHFFCKHSFHQHCFVSYCSSSEDECPVCLPRHNALRDSLNKQASERQRIVAFNSETGSLDAGVAREEDDVFARLADYLAAGLFTDYGATLADTAKPVARQQHQVAPSAMDSQRLTESRLRMQEAARSESLSAATSEGRLRQVVGGGTPMDDREGRVRAQEARYSTVSTTTEARIRSSGGTNVTAAESEARLRAGAASAVTARQSEARLRTAGVVGVTAGNRSEARTKQQSSARSFGGGSVRKVSSPASKQRSTNVPVSSPSAGRSISSSVSNTSRTVSQHHNPFEEPQDSNNPFGEDFETEDSANNPFSERLKDDKDLNPFGSSEDDYDSKLNPFGE